MTAMRLKDKEDMTMMMMSILGKGAAWRNDNLVMAGGRSCFYHSATTGVIWSSSALPPQELDQS